MGVSSLIKASFNFSHLSLPSCLDKALAERVEATATPEVVTEALLLLVLAVVILVPPQLYQSVPVGDQVVMQISWRR